MDHTLQRTIIIIIIIITVIIVPKDTVSWHVLCVLLSRAKSSKFIEIKCALLWQVSIQIYVYYISDCLLAIKLWFRKIWHKNYCCYQSRNSCKYIKQLAFFALRTNSHMIARLLLFYRKWIHFFDQTQQILSIFVSHSQFMKLLGLDLIYSFFFFFSCWVIITNI